MDDDALYETLHREFAVISRGWKLDEQQEIALDGLLWGWAQRWAPEKRGALTAAGDGGRETAGVNEARADERENICRWLESDTTWPDGKIAARDIREMANEVASLRAAGFIPPREAPQADSCEAWTDSMEAGTGTGERYRCELIKGHTGDHVMREAPQAAPTVPPLACLDCGLPYGTPDWVDTFVVPEQWRMIHDSEGGILCANCILRRASKLKGISVCHMRFDLGEAAPTVAPEQTCALSYREERLFYALRPYVTSCSCGGTGIISTVTVHADPAKNIQRMERCDTCLAAREALGMRVSDEELKKAEREAK